ncbi:hypothetical protein P8452_68999 [Trifolium repens]|nr:hypothetical protein P8452_68999 [Trifolium repens]
MTKVETKDTDKEEIIPEAELIPRFKITEVHVAGLKTEPQKKKLWGTSTQQHLVRAGCLLMVWERAISFHQ